MILLSLIKAPFIAQSILVLLLVTLSVILQKKLKITENWQITLN